MSTTKSGAMPLEATIGGIFAALITIFVLSGSAVASERAAPLPVPQTGEDIPGFGHASRGGFAGRTIPFSDETSLAACVAGAGPVHCVGHPELHLDVMREIDLGDFVTLDCRGGALSFRGIGLVVADRHDIVVRNCRLDSAPQSPQCEHPRLPLEAKGCGIPLLIKGESSNIAVLHDSFARCGEKCLEIFSEGLRFVDGHIATPDLITIAWSRFSDSYFGVGVGSTAATPLAQLAPHERVTFTRNICTGVFRRCVRAASPPAEVDESNNFVRLPSSEQPGCRGAGYGFGPSSTGGAQLLLRNNVLDDGGSSCRQLVDVAEFNPNGEASRGPGFVKASGDLLKGDTEERQNEPERVTFQPPEYPLLATGDVEAYVEANAGPVSP